MSYYSTQEKTQLKEEMRDAGAAAYREGKGPAYNPYKSPFGTPEEIELGRAWIAGYKAEINKYD